MTIREAAEKLARAIAKAGRATHLPANPAMVDACVAEHGELPPGVTVVDPDEPGVVLGHVGDVGWIEE